MCKRMGWLLNPASTFYGWFVRTAFFIAYTYVIDEFFSEKFKSMLQSLKYYLKNN